MKNKPQQIKKNTSEEVYFFPEITGNEEYQLSEIKKEETENCAELLIGGNIW